MRIYDESKSHDDEAIPLSPRSYAKSTLKDKNEVSDRGPVADDCIAPGDSNFIQKALNRHHIVWAPFNKSFWGDKKRGVFVFTQSPPLSSYISSKIPVYHESVHAESTIPKLDIGAFTLSSFLVFVPSNNSPVIYLAKLSRLYGDLELAVDGGEIIYWPEKHSIVFSIGSRLVVQKINLRRYKF